jgi:hypothetical protein
VFRIDAVWLAVQPIDMRAGADRLLASVVHVLGAAQMHHGYLFAIAVPPASNCWCTTALVSGAQRAV